MICNNDSEIPIAEGVYKWTFPNNRCYIGKTKNLKGRYKNYFSRCRKNFRTHPIVNALRKYGIENCQFQIVELTGKMPNKELLFRESLWIKHFRSLVSENGYNICSHSNDCAGIPKSDSHKEKLRLANLGKKASKETIEKLKRVARKGKDNHNFGINWGANYRHLNPGNTGTKLTIETKNLMREKAHNRNTLNYKNPPIQVKQINPQTNEIIKEWKSICAASIYLLGNKNGRSSIHNCCNGKSKLAIGFKWEYVNQR